MHCRPDSWASMLQALGSIFRRVAAAPAAASVATAITAFRPVLKFVLLNPTEGTAPGCWASGRAALLHGMLLRIARTSVAAEQAVVGFLLEQLPLMLHDSHERVGYMLALCSDLFGFVAASEPAADSTTVTRTRLVHMLAAVAANVAAAGGDPIGVVELMHDIYAGTARAVKVDDGMFATLAWLLWSCSGRARAAVCGLVDAILLGPPASPHVPFGARLLVAPLSQYFADLATDLGARGGGAGPPLNKATELIAAAKTGLSFPEQLRTNHAGAANTPSREFATLGQAPAQCFQAGQLCRTLFRSDGDIALLWLERQRAPPTPEANKHCTALAMMVAMALLSSHRFETVAAAAQTTVALAAREVPWALSATSVLIHYLSQAIGPRKKRVILDAFPLLAAQHVVVVGAALRLIMQLGESRSLRAVALSMLSRLWSVQRRVYPQLQAMIETPVLAIEPFGSSSRRPMTAADAVARARAVHALCTSETSQPDVVSAVAAISSIVNQSSETHDTALLLGMRALVALATRGLVEPRSAWKALAETFGAESRPAILAEIANLFGCFTATVDSLVDVEAEQFSDPSLVDNLERRMALDALWASTESDRPLRAKVAATQALAKFHPRGLIMSTEPVDRGSVGAESPPEAVRSVWTKPTAQKYAALLATFDMDELDSDAAAALTAFFVRAITDEVTAAGRAERTNWGRGTSRYIACSNSGERTASAESKRAALELHARYRRETRAAVRKGVGAGLLFAFEPADYGAGATELLGSLMADVGAPGGSFQLRLTLQHGWANMVSRVVQARTKDGAVVDARDAMVAQLADKFASLKRTPQTEANLVFAMGGLAWALPPHPGRRVWLSQLIHTALALLEGDRTASPSDGLLWPVNAAWSADARFAAALVAGAVEPMLQSSSDAKYGTTVGHYGPTVSVLLSHFHDAAEASIVRAGCAVALGRLIQPLERESTPSGAACTTTALVVDALWAVLSCRETDAVAELCSGCATALVDVGGAMVRCGLQDRLQQLWASAIRATTSAELDEMRSDARVAAQYSVALGWAQLVHKRDAEPSCSAEELEQLVERVITCALDSTDGCPSAIHHPRTLPLTQGRFERLVTLCCTSLERASLQARLSIVVVLGSLFDAQRAAAEPASANQTRAPSAALADALLDLAINSTAAAVASAASHVLGMVHQLHTRVATSVDLPSDLDYLPGGPFAAMKTLFSLLPRSAGDATPGAVLALNCFAQASALPPVDWADSARWVLASTAAQSPHASALQCAVVHLALEQHRTSPGLVPVTEQLMSAKTFLRLPAMLQGRVAASLGKLLALSASAVGRFLETTLPLALRLFNEQCETSTSSGAELMSGVAHGLLNGLKMSGDLAVWKGQCGHTLAAVLGSLQPTQAWIVDNKCSEGFDSLSKCVACLTTAEARLLLNIDTTTALAAAGRAALFRARLVSHAGYPRAWLEPCYVWLADRCRSAADALAVANSMGVLLGRAPLELPLRQRIFVDILNRLAAVAKAGGQLVGLRRLLALVGARAPETFAAGGLGEQSADDALLLAGSGPNLALSEPMARQAAQSLIAIGRSTDRAMQECTAPLFATLKHSPALREPRLWFAVAAGMPGGT